MSRERLPYVVVVEIDDLAIKTVYDDDGEEWPWSRQRYADLIRLLFDEYRVQDVGVDIYMPFTRDPEGNEALLEIARQPGKPVTLAQIFNVSSGRETQQREINFGSPAGGLPIDESQDNRIFPEATGYTGLNEQLSSAPCIGHLTPVKKDGLVTYVPPLVRHEGRLYPMLALEMLRCRKHSDVSYSVSPHPNGWKVELRGLMYKRSVNHLILDEQGRMRIPYRIAGSDLKTFSAAKILKGGLNEEERKFLDRKSVLLAVTGTGQDQQATPLEPEAAGVAVHAQLLDWLLRTQFDEGYGVAPDYSLDALAWLAGIAFLGLVVLMLLAGAGAGLIVTATVVMLAGWLGLGFWVWAEKAWFLPMHPTVLMALVLLLHIPLEWWLAQRTSGRLQQLFQDYLPAQLVRHIVNNDRADLLLPSKRYLTILFADIANFTRRAEHTSPDQLAQLTREILERLTAVAHQYEGTVDKYMGDAVLVFWNAPFSQADHADRGVQAALEMIEAIARFNREGNELLQGEPIAVRVGVHTGEVVVGDLGTRYRHAYTAIGDAVNVAARLQAQARELGESLVVSDLTVAGLQKRYTLIARGAVPLKGRQNAVGIYTLPPRQAGMD